MLVVGDGLKEIKRQLAKRKGVLLAGRRDDVHNYLQAMDIYVMPSLSETTCLSLLEAMSCELPCITTKVGFIKEYVKDRKNGIFFEKQNSYALYKDIKMLLDDKKMSGKLARAARKTVVKEFDWDKTAEGIEKVLLRQIKD